MGSREWGKKGRVGKMDDGLWIRGRRPVPEPVEGPGGEEKRPHAETRMEEGKRKGQTPAITGYSAALPRNYVSRAMALWGH
jgi:hypothetical protein